jgi:hypothetical protein
MVQLQKLLTVTNASLFYSLLPPIHHNFRLFDFVTSILITHIIKKYAKYHIFVVICFAD